MVAGLGYPGGPLEAQERNAGCCRSLSRMPPHATCEGMRRIDHGGDILVSEIGGKTCGAAKAADARFTWRERRLATRPAS